MKASYKEMIRSYKDPIKEDKVGGKFAKQIIMAKAQLPIPAFFCLTTEVYQNVVGAIQEKISQLILEIDWDNDQSIKACSKKIHQIFSDLVFEDTLENKILACFDQHFSSEELVSVRSSMVAYQEEFSEDSKDHAFAGMSESFLYVKRSSVIARIKECFASGFSPQVLIYRKTHNIGLMDFALAVGVQKMVFGERSFVMFTCDPNTLAKRTLVVGGYGIGEGVVQEKVETDHYFLQPKDKTIQRSIAHKEKRLGLDSEKGEGLIELDVDQKYRDLAVFNEDQLWQLHLMGEKIEKIFEAPQDIEGCFTEDNTLYILQSRPIQFSEQNATVWTNANVTESFPGTTTPLTFSFAQDFYRVIFTDCYRALGVPQKIITEHYHELDHMVGYLRGKIYYNLSSFYKLHSLSPLFPFFKKQWESMMGFSGSFYTQNEHTGWFKKISGLIYTFYGVLVISWRYLTNQRDVNRFLKRWDDLITPYRGQDFEDLSAFDLMKTYRRVWADLSTGWWITLLNDTHLPTAYQVVEFLFKKWGLDDDPSLLSNLLCGEEELKSVEIIYNGVRLSELVKADKKLLELFTTEEEMEVWRQINTNPAFVDFKLKLQDHLHRFGDRSLQELKIEQPSLREHPEELIKMIRNYLGQEISVDQIIAEEKERRLLGEQVLKERLRGSFFKYKLLSFQLWRLRGFIQNRENMRYCRSELFGFSKKIFKRMADHLVKEGQLKTQDDVYFLSVDEIFALVEGAAIDQNYKSLIESRRATFEEDKKIELPMDITTNGALYLNSLEPLDETLNDDLLKGLGSCPGKVQGRVRVVHDPNQVSKLGTDEILVAKETDPGWLFLMLAAKGIVVERGSMLSHTAITGRKFGIPTIVSVPMVTKKLKDGQLVEIDGARGTIIVLD